MERNRGTDVFNKVVVPSTLPFLMCFGGGSQPLNFSKGLNALHTVVGVAQHRAQGLKAKQETEEEEKSHEGYITPLRIPTRILRIHSTIKVGIRPEHSLCDGGEGSEQLILSEGLFV